MTSEYLCVGPTFERLKDGVPVDPHFYSWNQWVNIKELACLDKDGYQIILQERECNRCGLLQQRKVRL